MLRTLLLVLATTTPMAAFAQSQGLAPITDAQSAKIDAALQFTSANAQLTEAIAQARTTIAPFLKLHACMSDYNASRLNVFAAPGKVYHSSNYLKGPMPTMRKHPKTSCASVVRLQGWSLAANTLRFEAVYVSDVSGESGKSSHELQKQPNGEWLFSR